MSEYIDLDLPDEELLKLALEAHRDDVTLNQKLSGIIWNRLLSDANNENFKLKSELAILREEYESLKMSYEHQTELLDEYSRN